MMRLVDGNKGPYSCFYCRNFEEPLVQLGKEATDPDELKSGEEMVSPEDANAVEICEECLKKAELLFEGKKEA